MLKKSTVWDMKVTTDCGPVMLLLLFVCFILKWCFCLRSYITNLFRFKVQVTRVLLYLHIQVHPTWKFWDVFVFIRSFELIFITLSIMVPNSTSLLYRMRWSKTLKILLVFLKNDIPLGWGGGGWCSHFEKAKKIFKPTLQSPLLKFF